MTIVPITNYWRSFSPAEVDAMSADELFRAWHNLHKERERLGISLLLGSRINFFTVQHRVLIARATQGTEEAVKRFIEASL